MQPEHLFKAAQPDQHVVKNYTLKRSAKMLPPPVPEVRVAKTTLSENEKYEILHEEGFARNFENLELEGTHYMAHDVRAI